MVSSCAEYLKYECGGFSLAIVCDSLYRWLQQCVLALLNIDFLNGRVFNCLIACINRETRVSRLDD